MNHKQPPRRRKQIRLRGYDYRNAGAYFVTICTHQRRCTFGQVQDGRMRLNDWGQVVVRELKATEQMRDYVILDRFQCMPNHIHIILWIVSDDAPNVLPVDLIPNVGTQRAASLPQRSNGMPNVKPQSLSAIIRSYKSAVTKAINEMRGEKQPPVWQGRFHDRIVRNERELEAIRRYIENNPANWRMDQEFDAGLGDYLNKS